MPAAEENIVHSLDTEIEFAPVAKRRILPILGIILIVVAVLAAISYFAIYRPVMGVYAQVQVLKADGQQLATVAQSQDLNQIRAQVDVIDKQLSVVIGQYQSLGWMKMIPYFGSFVNDGQHGLAAAGYILQAGKLGIDGIAPYADVIGLKGLATTGDGAKTAQDRINFVINTLDKLSPQLTGIGEQLAKARAEVDQINVNRYPESFRGIAVRSQLASGISLLDQAESLVTDAKPLLESAPYMLGNDKPRKYLFLFQNDAELRPTGGFLTAYAIIEVNKGKLNILESNDIYLLDQKFPKKIAAPDPIKKYLPNVPYWYLRDQNLSPDFKVSMDTFFPNYQLTKSPTVDGIVAMDTQVLVSLLKVTGEIGVSGFGKYNANNDPRCNCPQVFYELEKFADQEGPVVWDPSGNGKIIFGPRNYGARKSFIGPMAQAVMANVFAQPKGRIPDLFNSIIALVNAKHIQLFFVDPKVQAAVESFNLAGRVRDYDGDYLLVVDTNFAGAKTNAWVTYDADQKIEVGGDGTVTKTLTLTYKNPQQYFTEVGTSLKLNGKFRDWLRVYVPNGSKLISTDGFETGEAVSTDLGKTVFEGFFTLTPQNTKRITIKYTLPMKITGSYKLLIQKQGGSKDFPYTITFKGTKQPEVILNSDKELVF